MRLFFFILLLQGASAFAGGSTVPNGGSSIVCFSIPVSQAIKDGKLTSEGAKSIQSARVLEFYLASLKRNQSSPFFRKLNAGDADGALGYLNQMIELVPRFAEDLAVIKRQLGQVGDGIAVQTALNPINDTELVLDVPEGCARVQTVTRRDGMFFYDAAVWDALGRQDPVQQRIMQLHEEIYTLDEPNWRSVPTQNVLIMLLSDPVTTRDFTKRLAHLTRYAIDCVSCLVDPQDARAIHFKLIDMVRSAIAAQPNEQSLRPILKDLEDLKLHGPVDPSLWEEAGDAEQLEKTVRHMIAMTLVHFDRQTYDADLDTLQRILKRLEG